MTKHPFNFAVADPSWQDPLLQGLSKVDPCYLEELIHSSTWLPGQNQLFNAFSLPLQNVNYILFGESPYPRRESANGYAFWDASVKEIWSPTGLSKKINRATSMRNIMKMLLVAGGYLSKTRTGQDEIAQLDKQHFVQTNAELFHNFLQKGFLLLNATLVLQAGSPQKDARYWYPFVQHILSVVIKKRPHVKFLLLGRIANSIEKIIGDLPVDKIIAEHPYNHSFIGNTAVLDFFKPLNILNKNQ